MKEPENVPNNEKLVDDWLAKNDIPEKLGSVYDYVPNEVEHIEVKKEDTIQNLLSKLDFDKSSFVFVEQPNFKFDTVSNSISSIGKNYELHTFAYDIIDNDLIKTLNSFFKELISREGVRVENPKIILLNLNNELFARDYLQTQHISYNGLFEIVSVPPSITDDFKIIFNPQKIKIRCRAI